MAKNVQMDSLGLNPSLNLGSLALSFPVSKMVMAVLPQ